jgi:hypothetical protein
MKKPLNQAFYILLIFGCTSFLLFEYSDIKENRVSSQLSSKNFHKEKATLVITLVANTCDGCEATYRGCLANPALKYSCVCKRDYDLCMKDCE